MWYTNGNEVLSKNEGLHKMPDETTPWVVKGVSAETRKKVKLYAVEHDMTMAQAVEQLVSTALECPGETEKRVAAVQQHYEDMLEYNPPWLQRLEVADDETARKMRQFATARNCSFQEALEMLLRDAF